MLEKFSIKIINDPEEIINYLQLGTQIPVLPEFYDTIRFDLEFFTTQAWIVKEEGNPIGFCLLFNDNKEELYFGFFNILDHQESCILFLVKKLKNYARENGFLKIRGPINIPTIIFGWGFMEQGSCGSLFIGKPVNPPIYQNIFLSQGFSIKTRQNTWEGKIPDLTPFLSNYDLSKFEIYHFPNWKEFDAIEEQFFYLSAKNLEPESVLTPCIDRLFPNYINFSKKYGKEFYFTFARDKHTDEMVGAVACLPNPFRKDLMGNLDSFTIFIIAIDELYRKIGLGWALLNYVFNKAKNNGIEFMSAPIENTQKATKSMVIKGELFKSRSHLILEYDIN